MIGVLENNLSIISSISKSIKDYISYFWQPSMDRNYRPTYETNSYSRKPKKEVDKNKHLNLDNIMVLRVSNNENEDYMITILGLSQNNSGERVLIRNGAFEKDVIDKCLSQNLELERKSVSAYMSEDEIEFYNQTLSIGNYKDCLSLLLILEAKIISQTLEQKNNIQLRLARKTQHQI